MGDNQKSMLCFVTAVWSIVASITAFAGASTWSTVGAPESGSYFNAGLVLVLGVVNFLGVNCPPTIKIANLQKPLYWGYFVKLFLCAVYALLFAFFPDKLVTSYGVDVLTGDALTVTT